MRGDLQNQNCRTGVCKQNENSDLIRWRGALCTDSELLGNRGRRRTKVCWSRRPFRRFRCAAELRGVRLDGPSPSGGGSAGRWRFLVTWYSSPPRGDPSRLVGFTGRTDIWKATIDLARLPRARR